ncbi:hypothetical protein [Bacillus altitudinis]|uniref:hypothetical protein n=1 Tax=Bacillus altitudinis TaxID=293387 RepID=UPI003F7701F4
MAFVFENITKFENELEKIGCTFPSGSFLKAVRKNVEAGAVSFDVGAEIEDGEDIYKLRVFFSIEEPKEEVETPIAALPMCRFDCLWLEKLEG